MMKKLTSILSIVGLICAMTFITSCEKDYVQYPPPIDPTDTIYYSADMQPFFDASCVNCHGSISPILESSVSYDNLINGGYINLSSPESSLLYTKINTGGSMEAYATQAERDMTLAWIEQGALNN